MTKIDLLGGAYTARSVIADAQRCVNLYPETNPEDAEAPVTYYQTPGLTIIGVAPNGQVWRGLYCATNNILYGVAGDAFYQIASNWDCILLGTVVYATTPVSMVDNGIELVLVDGTPNGYKVNLVTGVLTPIVDVAFYGSNRVDYLDTFMLFNKPDTKLFYSTLSNQVTPFDPLYIAGKTGFPDQLVAIIVMHREIWLLGTTTSEIWYNAGNAGFPFAIVPGVFIEHGCIAPYSVQKHDLIVFWLSQDKDGKAIVLRGVGYVTERISTFAIEQAINRYAGISDAIGMTYQQDGHIFYMLTFPSADKTWVYDMQVGIWHERSWLDSDGIPHRHRANCTAFAYGTNICGDMNNGNLYKLDQQNYTDFGGPIERRRGFPHLVADGKLVRYDRFVANIEAGTDDGATDGTDAQNPPKVYLRWSDTRGKSWSDPIELDLGALGDYLQQPMARQLGSARDRVFELFWSVPAEIALQGAYIDAVQLGA